MLYTTDLLNMLEVMFKGTRVNYTVVPCDLLQNVNWNQYPIAIVLNDSPSTSGGRHWLSMWVPSSVSPVHFFCSYGFGIDSYDSRIRGVLNGMGKDVVENTRTLQSFGTTVCGHYCIYALQQFAHGCCLMSLYKHFSSNTMENDRKVKQYVVRNFRSQKNYNKMMHSYKNQCCTPFE